MFVFLSQLQRVLSCFFSCSSETYNYAVCLITLSQGNLQKSQLVAEGFQEPTVTCAKCLSPLIPCPRKLDTAFLENLFLIAESCVKVSYEEAALSNPSVT